MLIKVSTRKVYNVCSKNYVRLYDAARRLAKHQLVHENFEYDEECDRFERDRNNNLVAPFYLMRGADGYDGYVDDFKNESEYEDFKKRYPSLLCFNHEKWAKMKEVRARKLMQEFKDANRQITGE